MESFQEFATAIEHLAYRTYPTLPEHHIRRKAGKALADGVGDSRHKNPAAARREDSKRGPQAGIRITGHTCGSQVPQN
jgi:hypothetical protein